MFNSVYTALSVLLVLWSAGWLLTILTIILTEIHPPGYPGGIIVNWKKGSGIPVADYELVL